MNERDDFFYQAVIYAKEKDYRAARAMLRNLLFQYPDDIEGLLLFSIVAQNRESSIQALKRILQIDPEHQIAFTKLAQLKYAPPELASIPTPTAPLPPLKPIDVPPPQPALTPIASRVPQPKAPEENIQRESIEPGPVFQHQDNFTKRKKKLRTFDIVLLSLLIIACLCLTALAMQNIYVYFFSNL
jgi:tetratricopeptide (TPR) repeat protein